MRERRITIAAHRDIAEQVRARWFSPVLAHWPRADQRPEATVVDLSDLLARIDAGLDAAGEHPVLMVFGPDATKVEVRQAIDRVQTKLLPAVLLVSEPTYSAVRARAEGVLIESWDAEPARLATMLYTIGERQDLVRSLARELRIAHRSHGGLCGEMDKVHEEMQLAASVQRELLPVEMPRLPGLAFGAIFRPCGYVSGDIYDFRELDEHRVAFLVADAVGHGVPAALLTVALCRSVTSRERDGDRWRYLEPAEAMTRLNRDLCTRQNTPHRFATAIYGFIDGRTRRVTIAGAGHPAPLVFGPDGVRKLETNGPLLGVFEDGAFDQVSTVLAPGETLVMFTDGVESAFPGTGVALGDLARPTTRYVDYLGAFARRACEPGSSLRHATDELIAVLEDQTGSLHQIDDITTLAISVPLEAPASTQVVAAAA